MKKELRGQVYLKYAGRCAYCGYGIRLDRMQVDHIIPKGQAGKNRDDLANLNPACRCCNNWKYNKGVEQFRLDLEAQVDRARQYSRNFRMAERYGLISVNTPPKVKFYFEI